MKLFNAKVIRRSNDGKSELIQQATNVSFVIASQLTNYALDTDNIILVEIKESDASYDKYGSASRATAEVGMKDLPKLRFEPRSDKPMPNLVDE